MAEERTGPQNLILEGRKRLSVSGVEEVDAFDENAVRLRTSLGELLILGEDMQIRQLSVETGELLVTGTITELSYTEPRRRDGWLGRLFG